MRTIVHLSDLHFGAVTEALLEPLRRAVLAADPDLVVVSGDLTQRARTKQFEDARDYLATLPRPQIVVPGNHDVPLYDVYRRFFKPLERFTRIVTADLEPTFIDDEIAVVGVNTARALVFKGGRINEEQVESIRAKICHLPESVTKMLVTHHPFDVPKDARGENQIVGRARMALERLADCGADILLSGHLHASRVGHTAERYRIAGLSALVVQAGTATSHRARGERNSFNVLRAERDRIAVEQFVEDGGEFARAATQQFAWNAQGWSSVGPHDAPR